MTMSHEQANHLHERARLLAMERLARLHPQAFHALYIEAVRDARREAKDRPVVRIEQRLLSVQQAVALTVLDQPPLPLNISA